jgi:hypothetical protein
MLLLLQLLLAVQVLHLACPVCQVSRGQEQAHGAAHQAAKSSLLLLLLLQVNKGFCRTVLLMAEG